jgi:tetratricopeptide (TPR) repeat protein
MMMPGADWYTVELYAAMVRFGLWDDILAEPTPDPKLTGLTGAYLHAKATAFAAKGRLDEAKAELANLEKLTVEAAYDDSAGLSRLKDVLAVAVLASKARIARAEKKPDDAIGILREAVAQEDQLAYSEPADWFFPNRHQLGAVLLNSNRAVEAEALYRDDLGRHPDNGWALYGLARALEAQGRAAEISTAQQQFSLAWKNADVTLSASAF